MSCLQHTSTINDRPADTFNGCPCAYPLSVKKRVKTVRAGKAKSPTMTVLGQARTAIEAMPNLPYPARSIKTGTYDVPDEPDSSSLRRSCVTEWISANSGGQSDVKPERGKALIFQKMRVFMENRRPECVAQLVEQRTFNP